jgi:DNA-binding NarL/FixJ family response regulator
MKPLEGAMGADAIERNRRRIVNIFRALGDQVPSAAPQVAPLPPETANLAPRLQQTLKHLLDGDSEKQIAAKLALSRHTVHVYVKGLYRHFGASSRGELLSRWVKPR